MFFILKCALYVVLTLFCISSVSLLAIIIVLYFLATDLPDHNELRNYSPSLSSRVFLQDGSKLCEYSNETRYFIPINKVPDKLKNAFIAVEDKHFYDHAGIDIYGIVRSLVSNILNIGTGKRPQGASTITQQVARLFLIKTNELSYIRKIKEAILALRIETALPKEKILELYVNHLYMGIGNYGVAAAAKHYFDKSVNELTISECAYLAALAKGANNYHPVRNKQRAIDRRNWALSRLSEDGYISRKDAELFYKQDITLKTPSKNFDADYYAEEVRKELIKTFSIENLNKEGLIIRCTLDEKLQKYAYEALRKGLEKVDRQFGWRGAISHVNVQLPHNEIARHLEILATSDGARDFLKAAVLSVSKNNVLILTENRETGTLSKQDVEWAKNKIKIGDVVFVQYADLSGNFQGSKFVLKQIPKVQGAIVVLDVNTGRILAMQGGYCFQESKFNRVTQANRQLGSVFKPFVYLCALENGYAPNTIIDASSVSIDLGHNQIWTPKNYGNSQLAEITLRQAIERSVNTATVRIAQDVGMDKISKISEIFGIVKNMPPYFAYALGACESTPLKITLAYAMLANGGKKITPKLIDYVQDKNGNTIYKSDERNLDSSISFDATFPPCLVDDRAQIVDERSVYQLNSLLEGVVQRGSGQYALQLRYPVAGKTGTSNDSKDTWFVGYTADIAVGVFVGFDEYSKSLGKRAVGAVTALPIFIDFMEKAKSSFPAKPFKVPNGIKLRKISIDYGAEAEIGAKTILEAFKAENDESELENHEIYLPINTVKPNADFEDNKQSSINSDINKNNTENIDETTALNEDLRREALTNHLEKKDYTRTRSTPQQIIGIY